MNRKAARKTALLFLKAIERRDFAEALNYAQPSWVDGIPIEREDRKYLQALLGGLGITDVSVGVARPVESSKCMADVRYGFNVRGRKVVGSCRVIREDDEGHPAPDGPGRWGVNPNSVVVGMKMPKRQGA